MQVGIWQSVNEDDRWYCSTLLHPAVCSVLNLQVLSSPIWTDHEWQAIAAGKLMMQSVAFQTKTTWIHYLLTNILSTKVKLKIPSEIKRIWKKIPFSPPGKLWVLVNIAAVCGRLSLVLFYYLFIYLVLLWSRLKWQLLCFTTTLLCILEGLRDWR